ncbi:AI-2E family transporter [Desulfosoma sp.]
MVVAWLKRSVGNPQVMILLGAILGVLIGIIAFGSMLKPVFAGWIIAYLLEGPVKRLQAIGVPRLASVTVVFIVFLALLILLCLVVIPTLVLQVTDFIERIPEHMIRLRNALAFLPQRYPDLITEEEVAHLMSELTRQIHTTGQQLALRSIVGVLDVIGAVVYIFLVPVLVFFFMKDKDRIALWLFRFLPEDRPLIDRVLRDVDVQMSCPFGKRA